MMKLVLLSALLLVTPIAAVKKPQFSVTIKDTTLDGASSLDIDGELSHKFSDDIVGGVNYDLNVARDIPSQFWLRGRIAEVLDSEVLGKFVYDVKDKVTKAVMTWKTDTTRFMGTFDTNLDNFKLQLARQISLDTGNMLIKSSLGFKDDGDTKLDLFIAKSLNGEKTNVALEFSNIMGENGLSVFGNPEVTLFHELSPKEFLSPTVNLKTRKVTHKYVKKFEEGGSLEAQVNDKVLQLGWLDKGTFGTWDTTAKIPLEDPSGTTLTFKRTFSY
uniref:Uncharacterized protein n=1 Tax=Fibrocapsa japonica TaxID=94617 RepID=A0A7S2XUK3_9STRA|mmetsp:Transcript_1010/g.1430  ORF Transcript_1010/g.1430 Transcript_1010/m.1430 type:complete len:273 (+) Transcript_1010:136-954(+)